MSDSTQPDLESLVAVHGGVAFGIPSTGGAMPLRAGDPRLNIVLSDVQLHAGRIRGGELFAALAGHRVDGWRYAPDALERGASVVLSAPDRSIEALRRRAARSGLDLSTRVLWVHPRAREIAGEVAADVHGHPVESLAMAGVTGTNGKTSVCHIASQLLEGSGMRPAVIGTAGHRLMSGRGMVQLSAVNTTPDATELHRLFGRHLAAGGDSALMEVSSHGLVQGRLAGIKLRAAAFTNLTREHLDYHGTMEDYLLAKARIWDCLEPGGVAVIFGHSESSRKMRQLAMDAGARVVTVDAERGADLMARNIERSRGGASFELVGMGIPARRVTLPLRGDHNIENALVAAALARSLGVGADAVAHGLASIASPPGRLERVSDPSARGDGAIDVLVDYAHSPDAIERVLGSLRMDIEASESVDARLICVFGCGGDRDRGKREPMGRAAGRIADVSIVTSDNPRSEDPSAIANAVVRGIDQESGRRIVELDRRRAIERALEIARPGDVVLIAGKGHENTQTIGDAALPFDDRVVAEELLRAKANGRNA